MTNILTPVEKVDAVDFALLAKKLDDKEKERFYFIMVGALMARDVLNGEIV